MALGRFCRERISKLTVRECRTDTDTSGDAIVAVSTDIGIETVHVPVDLRAPLPLARLISRAASMKLEDLWTCYPTVFCKGQHLLSGEGQQDVPKYLHGTC